MWAGGHHLGRRLCNGSRRLLGLDRVSKPHRPRVRGEIRKAKVLPGQRRNQRVINSQVAALVVSGRADEIAKVVVPVWNHRMEKPGAENIEMWKAAGVKIPVVALQHWLWSYGG